MTEYTPETLESLIQYVLRKRGMTGIMTSMHRRHIVKRLRKDQVRAIIATLGIRFKEEYGAENVQQVAGLHPCRGAEAL